MASYWKSWRCMIHWHVTYLRTVIFQNMIYIDTYIKPQLHSFRENAVFNSPSSSSCSPFGITLRLLELSRVESIHLISSFWGSSHDTFWKLGSLSIQWAIILTTRKAGSVIVLPQCTIKQFSFLHCALLKTERANLVNSETFVPIGYKHWGFPWGRSYSLDFTIQFETEVLIYEQYETNLYQHRHSYVLQPLQSHGNQFEFKQETGLHCVNQIKVESCQKKKFVTDKNEIGG